MLFHGSLVFSHAQGQGGLNLYFSSALQLCLPLPILSLLSRRQVHSRSPPDAPLSVQTLSQKSLLRRPRAMLVLSRPGPVRAPDPPLDAPLPEAAHRGRARGVLGGGACAVAAGVRHRPRVHLLGELLAGGGHLQGGEDAGPSGGRSSPTLSLRAGGLAASFVRGFGMNTCE